MFDPKKLDETLVGLDAIEAMFEKAAADAVAFGEGWIRVKGGKVEHIPFAETRKALQAQQELKQDG